MGSPIAPGLPGWGAGKKAAPFDPTKVAGLIARFDAAALALADNALVSTWPDTSGNARDATGAGASRPTFKAGIQNGKGGVRFAGSHFLVSTFGVTLAQPNVILMVASMTAAGGFYFDGISGTARHIIGDNLGIAALNHMIYASSGGVKAPQAIPVGPALWTGVFNGTSSSLRKNAAAFAADATNIGNHSLTGLTLGASNSQAGGFLTGDLHEVLVFDPNISTTDRDFLEAGLKSKWGL